MTISFVKMFQDDEPEKPMTASEVLARAGNDLLIYGQSVVSIGVDVAAPGSDVTVTWYPYPGPQAKVLDESEPDLKLFGGTLGGGMAQMAADVLSNPFAALQARTTPLRTTTPVPTLFGRWNSYQYTDPALRLSEELRRRNVEYANMLTNPPKLTTGEDFVPLVSLNKQLIDGVVPVVGETFTLDLATGVVTVGVPEPKEQATTYTVSVTDQPAPTIEPKPPEGAKMDEPEMVNGARVEVRLHGDDDWYAGEVIKARKQWVQLDHYPFSKSGEFIADENSIAEWREAPPKPAPAAIQESAPPAKPAFQGILGGNEGQRRKPWEM